MAAKLLPNYTNMSRIGKQPIIIPATVTVSIDKSVATITGPKGTLSLNLPRKIKVEVIDNNIIVSRLNDDKQSRADHGTTRAHLNNFVHGVVEPWKKEIEIRGTGYKFKLDGNNLTVTVGFIHPVKVTAPAGIQFVTPEDTKLTITGCNRELVGQIASNIRKIKPPEPYKGKGIRYLNEFIKLKAGKTAKA